MKGTDRTGSPGLQPRDGEPGHSHARAIHHHLGTSHPARCMNRPLPTSHAAGYAGAHRACRRDRPASGITRRRFIKSAAVGTAGLIAGPHLFLPRAARGNSRMSRIVRTHHPDATSGMNTVHQEPVDLMVHTAVRALTGITDTAEAWKSFFPGITPDNTVSIKINLACGDVPTHPEVVNAIIDGLLMMDLGGQQLPPEHIIVWDADTGFMCPQTGYQVNWGGPGVQYVGTDHPDIGYDYTQVFTVHHGGSITTDHHVSRIISELCDYMINAAVIKDHDDWAGVTLTMKNNYGSFDNIYNTQMHYGGYNTGLPGLNMILRDELDDKTKLFLIDATLGLYDGGPGYIPPYHTPPNWAYNSFLVGLDLVALDRIGTVKINEERANHGLPPIDPGHITAAAGDPYYLGTDDLEEIELIEIELGAQDIPPGSLGPRGVALLAPYPNPTRNTCTLRMHCQAESDAEILITDATGAVVRRIADGRYGPGMHRFNWNGQDERGRPLPSGTYFCRLRTAGGGRQQRVVLVR